MNLQKSIKRVLKEESFKERIVDLVETRGLLYTLDVMSISYVKLFSLIGNEWVTRKIQIEFIQDLMRSVLYGFGLSEVGVDPIFYNENESEYRQIDYIGKKGVTVDVIPKYDDGEYGDFFVSFHGLDDRIINELFDVMIQVYENHPEFFK